MERLIYETEDAQCDILGIWNFIAYSNPVSGDVEAADRVIDSIQETYRHLLGFPLGTKIAPEGIYRFPVRGFQQYLILYRFDDEKIEVLRVFRADLDWTRVMKEFSS